MIIVHGKNPYEAWYKANQAVLENPDSVMDYHRLEYFMKMPYVLEIDSYDISEMDYRDVGYRGSKEKHLERSYPIINTIPVERFKKYKFSQGYVIRFNSKKPYPCLENITITKVKDKIQVTVYSRAAELTMRLYADMIYINKILKKFGEDLGFEPQDCKLTWYIHGPWQSMFMAQIFWELFSDTSLDEYEPSKIREKLIMCRDIVYSDREYVHRLTQYCIDFVRNNKVRVYHGNKKK